MNKKIDQWHGCYDDGWQGSIVPEAFSHPAKFSRGLIHRIYQHAKEMGWVKSGDWIRVTEEIRELIKKELDNGLYLRVK